MQDVNAASQATELVRLIIQHCPQAMGVASLSSEEGAKKAAQAIATLRSELIEKLKQQQ